MQNFDRTFTASSEPKLGKRTQGAQSFSFARHGAKGIGLGLEIGAAVAWILGGNVLQAESAELEKAREFWAFRPVQRSVPPAVQNIGWVLNPVDQFILAKLEEHGLQPAPPAAKIELIRRVFFDVTGLPPAPEEIKAFIADGSAEAYERLVDRLLNSPHFGERWAQHWLDVVRFAETEGFEYDRHLPEAWRFRDYVIESFNQDKPFNRFVTEQIAGDEIDPDDLTCQTASVFHRLGPVRRNAGNPEIALSRNEVLTERTDIIGAAFLGLTVGCARCHDHKLDPISQEDYYRLQAYVAGTHEHDLLLVPEEQKKDWEQKTKSINGQLRKLRKEAEDAEPEERERLKQQIESLEAQLPPYPPTVPGIHNDAEGRTPIHVLQRGDWEKKGKAVGPRPLSVLVQDGLAELPPDTTHPRTELAQWLTDANHPLTARVIVNRLWQHHFGAGIVSTSNDFGTHGDRPSHPELLDWLAARLIDGGWRLKPIHRLILLSRTYQQSSQSPPLDRVSSIDPENRLHWKFSRRRLSAEEIRDAMLAASGKLNLELGGASIMVRVDPELVQLLYKPSQWEVAKDPSQHYRRSIYLIAKRNLRLPFMETFDQPALQTSCARRESSTHAPQALEMLNGRLANELAQAFAERLELEGEGQTGATIDRAFWLVAGRPPTPAERQLAGEFLGAQSLKEFALAMFNLNAFLYVP